MPLCDVPKTLQKLGFRDVRRKSRKKRDLSEGSLCASAKREIFACKSHFFGFARRNMFFCAVPETTIFIVVSGAHTGVVLVDVPGTTIKIVVSGT